jgi:hypothetical protein
VYALEDRPAECTEANTVDPSCMAARINRNLMILVHPSDCTEVYTAACACAVHASWEIGSLTAGIRVREDTYILGDLV